MKYVNYYEKNTEEKLINCITEQEKNFMLNISPTLSLLIGVFDLEPSYVFGILGFLAFFILFMLIVDMIFM